MATNKMWINIMFRKIMEVKRKFLATFSNSFVSFTLALSSSNLLTLVEIVLRLSKKFSQTFSEISSNVFLDFL